MSEADDEVYSGSSKRAAKKGRFTINKTKHKPVASVISYNGAQGSTASYTGGRTSNAARPSMAVNINEAPGQYVSNLFAEKEDKDIEDDSHLMGTFLGVYKPTCLMMWGVIIFLRFGEVVGQAGIGLCVFSVLMSAIAAGLTASSVSALVSNGVPSGDGGVYRLLTRSLGASIGGSFSILYFLGLTVMACVEIVGFTESLHHVLGDKIGHHITGSSYTDQLMFGICIYIVLWAAMYVGHKLTAPISMLILVVLLGAYLSSFIGFFATLGGWATGLHFVHVNDTYLPVTGLSSTNFINNFGPDFDQGYSYNRILTFIFPCFIGIFRGAGNAHMLKNPSRSMPLGAFGAILTSASFYILILCFLGSVAPRETLKEHYLLFEKVGWPTEWIPLLGLILVPLSAAIEYLELSQAILKIIAEERLLPFPQCLRLDQVGAKREREGKREREERENSRGIPPYALAGSMIVALPFIFIPNLDIIATIVTMLYLLNYAAVNFSCFLMTVLGSPSWRPSFRFYHKFFTALPGFLLCMAIMFLIQWWAALIASFCFVLLAIYIEVRSDANIWGHGVRGLKMHLALQALVDAEKVTMEAAYNRLQLTQSAGEVIDKDKDTDADIEPIDAQVVGEQSNDMNTPPPIRKQKKDSKNSVDSKATTGEQDDEPVAWRPQVLVMLRMTDDHTLDREQHSLLSFVRMLTKSSSKGGLIIAGNVIAKSEEDKSTDMFHKSNVRKAILQENLQAHKLSGFAEVVVAPSAETGTSILVQTAGLGPLKPNTIIAAWPEKREINGVLARPLVNLIAQSRAENKAMLFIKGLDTLPDVNTKSSGYIDIWWVVQEGGLLLLLGHLLSQHRTWRNCQLRVFTVASVDSNSVAIGNGLRRLLDNLRIKAQVHVVEMCGQELTPFAAEFTVHRHSAISEIIQGHGRPLSHPLRPTRLGTVFPSCVNELVALDDITEHRSEEHRHYPWHTTVQVQHHHNSHTPTRSVTPDSASTANKNTENITPTSQQQPKATISNLPNTTESAKTTENEGLKIKGTNICEQDSGPSYSSSQPSPISGSDGDSNRHGVAMTTITPTTYDCLGNPVSINPRFTT
eukprot:Ihof_evm9s110 gene=Ihof_evmTU9s110